MQNAGGGTKPARLRVVEQAQGSGEVLYVRRLHKRRPPYLRYGTRRAVSSSSMRSLWCAARTSTAWSHNRMPSSWHQDPVDPQRGPHLESSWQRTRPAADRPAFLRAAQGESGLRRPDEIRQVQSVVGCGSFARGLSPLLWRTSPTDRAGSGHRNSKSVDRLGVVSYDVSPLPVGSEEPHDLDLQGVDVLVLVGRARDRTSRHARPEAVIAKCRPPQRAADRRSQPGPLSLTGDVRLDSPQ